MKNFKLLNTTIIFDSEEEFKIWWDTMLIEKLTDSEINSCQFIIRKRSWFTKFLFYLLKV